MKFKLFFLLFLTSALSQAAVIDCHYGKSKMAEHLNQPFITIYALEDVSIDRKEFKPEDVIKHSTGKWMAFATLYFAPGNFKSRDYVRQRCDELSQEWDIKTFYIDNPFSGGPDAPVVVSEIFATNVETGFRTKEDADAFGPLGYIKGANSWAGEISYIKKQVLKGLPPIPSIDQ